MKGGGGTASIVSFLPRHRCSKICDILRPLPIQIALTCFTDTLTWLLSDMLSECQCHTVSVNVSRLECTHTSNDFSKIKSPGSSHPPAEDDIRGKGLIDCRPLIFLLFFLSRHKCIDSRLPRYECFLARASTVQIPD